MNEESGSDASTLATARQCAVRLLNEVLDHKRPFDEAAARNNALAQLADRDRNFVRLLVMTALRRLGQIDALLAQMLSAPLKGKSQDVMHALRLGVVQLVWLETPAHAAVHSMVNTVAALGFEPMKGLVNAVLKRISREGAAIISAQDEAKLNLPGWLYQSWCNAYGEAQTRAMAATQLIEPPLDLTVKQDAAQWAKQLGGEVLPTGSLRLTAAGRVDALPGYNEGAWWVQDAAASLPVQLLGDVRGKTIIDLCAAPGGKTAQLAAAGAKVIAVDKSRRRLATLSANMERLGLQVEMVEGDALKWKPTTAPDVILLDAPCSATGTLRRHPEIAWVRTQEDVVELAALQKRLLHRTAAWLKPGGILLYCVCSLQPEEGEQQTQDFEADHTDFVPVSRNASSVYAENDSIIRTHPALLAAWGGMDGFYAKCWVRLNNP